MDRELKKKCMSLVLAIVGLIAFSNLVSGYDAGSFTISQVPIDATRYGGEDYPNWTHGTVCMGMTYDAGIEMVSSEDLTDVVLQLRFDTPNDLPSEIAVAHWSGTAWVFVVFEAVDGILVGSFGIPGSSLEAGNMVVVPLLVTFCEVGAYHSQIWAEGVP